MMPNELLTREQVEEVAARVRSLNTPGVVSDGCQNYFRVLPLCETLLATMDERKKYWELLCDKMNEIDALQEQNQQICELNIRVAEERDALRRAVEDMHRWVLHVTNDFSTTWEDMKGAEQCLDTHASAIDAARIGGAK